VVFILETAPKDKRATIYALTKCLGTVGLVLVPVLRRVFLDADATNWRPLFMIPGIMALIVGVVGLLFIRESKVFVDSRIEHLEKPYEERHPAKVKLTKEEKKALKKSQRKAGVFPAVKYLFTHNKDLRWLTIAYMILSVAMVPMSQYYESIMTTGGMTTAQVTDAQFVYPFGFAAIIMLGGLIGDKFGRKRTSLVTGIVSMISFCMFVYGACHGWNSYFIGVLYSLFLGGYWTCMDYLTLMVTEKVPTDVRGSALGAFSLLQFAGVGVGMGGLLGGLAVFNTAFVGTICAFIAVPAMVISLLIAITKVKETMGTDLHNVE
jgi:MFS family permease